MLKTSREFVMTAFVRARDVMRAWGCKRSTAYAHMRRAIGRTDGRGLLRVPLDVWERYARSISGAPQVAATERDLSPLLSGRQAIAAGLPLRSDGSNLIPVTQPRTVKKGGGSR